MVRHYSLTPDKSENRQRHSCKRELTSFLILPNICSVKLISRQKGFFCYCCYFFIEKLHTTYFDLVFPLPPICPRFPLTAIFKQRKEEGEEEGHGENREKREGGKRQRTRGKEEEGRMEEGLTSGPEVLSKIKP